MNQNNNNHNKNNNIGAFLQCYKNPLATYHSILSFRNHYPLGTIVLLSDNGYDYTEMSNHFNCIYIHETENLPLVWYPFKDTDLYNKTNKLINRIINAFQLCKEEYIMWLEDDVSVNNRVNENELIYDLNGYAPNKFLQCHLIELKKTYPFIDINKQYVFSGHGGSIYKKNNIINYLQNTELKDDLLNNWKEYKFNECAQDFFISLLIILQGGTIGQYTGHLDGITNIIYPNITVQHQYKRWYGVSMPEEIKHLVSF
jgi:hypothetical protein